MDPGVTSDVYSLGRNAWGLEALCVRTDLPTPSRDLSYVVSWRRLTATVTEDVNGDGLCVLPRTGGRAVSAQKVPSLSGKNMVSDPCGWFMHKRKNATSPRLTLK